MELKNFAQWNQLTAGNTFEFARYPSAGDKIYKINFLVGFIF